MDQLKKDEAHRTAGAPWGEPVTVAAEVARDIPWWGMLGVFTQST